SDAGVAKWWLARNVDDSLFLYDFVNSRFIFTLYGGATTAASTISLYANLAMQPGGVFSGAFSGDGSALTKLPAPHVFSLTKYGGDPTGAASSTAAWNAAEAAIVAAGGGILWVEEGTFIHDPAVATRLLITSNMTI